MTEPTVYDAFHSVFPDIYTDRDEEMRSIPLDSNCGDECRLAIKAASGVLKHVRQAYGEGYPTAITALALITSSVCGCYITG